MNNELRNELGNELSLYLRQHADNPVHWQPWSPESLQLADDLNRPVFVSIGYSACHWCHVMSRESFENDSIATTLNDRFVSIKMDREEFPNVDLQYMLAVQLIQGHAGWPLNVFALPDGRPFFGGTYFPRTARNGLPGFGDLLNKIAEVWRNEPDKLATDATQISQGVFNHSKKASPADVTEDGIHAAIATSLASVDEIHGGKSGSPKFPPYSSLRLWQYALTLGPEDPLVEQALRNTLDHMCWSGLRDQVGGAFHRYCVDECWQIPHFEQMLSDNAQMLRILASAVLAGARDTDSFVLNQLLAELFENWITEHGWFAAAWDADDRIGEGYYYTWTPQELNDALLDDAPWTAEFYQVKESGPIDGRSTLSPKAAPDRREHGLDPEDIWKKIRHATVNLRTFRSSRERPVRDDKGLVGDNGFMLYSLAIASRTRPAEHLDNWHSVANTLLQLSGAEALPRVWYPTETRGSASLSDHAGLGLGLLHWGLRTDQPDFCEASLRLANKAVSLFAGHSWTVDQGLADLGAPVGIHDSQYVSPIAAALEWFTDCFAVTGDDRWRQITDELTHHASGTMSKYPEVTLDLWRTFHRCQQGSTTLFLVGEETVSWYERLCRRTPADLIWIPHQCCTWLQSQGAPSMNGKDTRGGYFCQAKTCHAVKEHLSELSEVLENTLA